MKPTIKALCLLSCVLLLAPRAYAEPGSVAAYETLPDKPKYVTAMIEFSDPESKIWPNLFAGKPVEEGRMVPDPKEPVFTGKILCETVPQTGGEQNRRILGELFTQAEAGRTKAPAISFQYQNLTNLEYPAKDNKGKENARLGKAQVQGTLSVGDKTVPAQGGIEFRFEGGKDGNPSEVQCQASVIVQASDLGLNNFKGPVKVRVFSMAYARGASPVKK